MASVATPRPVVTTTAATPTEPGGVVPVIDVAVSEVTVSDEPPTVTEVADAKLDPVMVMTVLPTSGPVEGATPVMVGLVT